MEKFSNLHKCTFIELKNVYIKVFKFTFSHLLPNLYKILRISPYSVRMQEFCNFITKETMAQVFSYEFRKISKNTFSTEHLRWLLLKKNVKLRAWEKWVSFGFKKKPLKKYQVKVMRQVFINSLVFL